MVRIRKLSIRRLVREWKGIIANEKDIHVAICGDEGDGKTHLMIQFIQQFPWANIWKNMIYSSNHKEFYDKYEELKLQSVLGFDEGLDFLDRQLWARIETKKLLRFIRGTVRKEKSGVFLYNAQLFRDIHGYWRNHRIRYWIEILKRDWFDNANIAIVMRKGRLPFITGHRDTWLLDDSEKMWLSELSKYGDLSRKQYLNNLRKHPFYIGEFLFKELPGEVKKQYLQYRLVALEKYKLEDPKEKVNRYTIALDRLMSYLRREERWSWRRMGMVSGISDKTCKARVEDFESRNSN